MKYVRLIFIPLICGAFVALGFAFGSGMWRMPQSETSEALRGALNGSAPSLSLPWRERRMERPWGMAPEPFRAYLRACAAAKVHPWRIGQTIGDHPRSVGYHKSDGFIVEDGRRYEYTAAIDVGALDMTEARREIFLEALARQGFTPFWRSGPNWQGSEHIHAVYALIPMKPQLRGQVLEWLDKRRAEGKRLPRWVRKLRRSPQFRRALS
jgi:hypothetical protein